MRIDWLTNFDYNISLERAKRVELTTSIAWEDDRIFISF